MNFSQRCSTFTPWVCWGLTTILQILKILYFYIGIFSLLSALHFCNENVIHDHCWDGGVYLLLPNLFMWASISPISSGEQLLMMLGKHILSLKFALLNISRALILFVLGKFFMESVFGTNASIKLIIMLNYSNNMFHHVLLTAQHASVWCRLFKYSNLQLCIYE